MSKKISIHSDGTGQGTVVLTEDGEALANISELSISIEPGDVVRATLYVNRPIVNVVADSAEVVMTCPICSESHEHRCNPSFPGDNVLLDHRCESKLVLQDPYTASQCIRKREHSKAHFDGERVW